MAVQITVFVIDDDELARSSICALVQSIGLNAESFASAEEFLHKYVEGWSGCLITDLRMPGMSGMDLQEQLMQRGIFLPVIILTAYARTPTTVRAIKAGAISVLDKPYADDDLLDAIRAALAKEADERVERLHRQDIRSNLAKLTPTELKVLDMIVQGLPNKVIAQELNVSLRTVENRRQEIYAKMQAKSAAELIRLVVEAEKGYFN
jgi:two-component system, LuxR family, response regulator FixJ